ncbi:MAG: flagellar filament capping protein FliD [Desulfobacterales bacterium]|uniref:Filament cap protein n=1 Tax=Candidatus Desulfatibia vada TaxID=2841696 RepID=A0A8J6NTZ7_9BACT|nr:flagellar filament capping protein FliD [Candidatus Desulfatibia vada]MBL6971187.1 flagellar filament capping protein FliD [Desulfobacterales bacterium]
MSLSTNLISGLSSGFDWRSMIDQLISIDNRRVELIEDRKSEYQTKLDEWQSVNSMLLALKTATGALSTQSAFNVYTSGTTSDTSTSASDRLTVSTSSSASPGMHQIRVDNLAQSNKLSSNSYAATDTALSLTAGDILISGRVVNITATDTLADIEDKINTANTGSSPSNVTASIVQYGTNDYRLVLTSDDTGVDEISILNGSANDILFELGFKDTTRTAKTHIAGGDKSDGFTSTDENIKALLGLSTTQTSLISEIKINGLDVAAIDLSTDTLNTLKVKFAATGVDVSIITETVDGTNYYRLLIEGGSNTYTDKNNILETLGILQAGSTDVYGVKGDTANTSSGAIITESTLIKDIDGYSGHATDDYIHLEGTHTDGVTTPNDDTLLVANTTTVGDLLTKIESLFGDVTASITGDGKIMVTDDTTGASPLALIIAVKDNGGADDNTLNFDVDDNLGTAASLRIRKVVAGKDASIVVDGVTVTDSSNTLTDVIQGVTLNLVGEDGVAEDTTITVKVERDLGAVKSKITTMNDAFNTIMDYINTQFTYDDENEQVGGILFGDGTLSSVKTELIRTVTKQITGLPSGYDYLSLIGITLDLTDTEEGKYDNMNLAIDDDKLTDALETNFNDVKNLFIAYGSGSNPNLTYISHTSDTQGGSYTVDITTAATQGTTTGSDPAVTLTGAETLTIEDFATGRVATVSLTSGWDLDTVINAINSELALEYTQKIVGDQVSQDKDTNNITSSTLFSNITGAEDTDVITFSGTRRNGISVSGSYTVDTTKTIGDLLNTIEDMFEDEVTATISGGKIVITDTQSGDSHLTFAINTLQVSNLNFGDVDVDPVGADGSQKGRYAMTITASKTGSNELLLTHNLYGTGQRAIVTETGGAGDLKLTTPVYVWGENVAGTIGSATATGSGQTLTVDSDGDNADGLSISYTGTSTLTSATFSFALGVAELLDRQLGFITDASDGYVTYKQTSLKNSIDSFETQIENMEASLNRKMETMINRFVAMELALAKIQNQSQWLAGQISASLGGWGSL